MYRPISAEKHFETGQIQGNIANYANCSDITEEGKSCRSSLTTNKFINPITKQRWNCNWYCLRNCSREKLKPIFENRPQFLYFRDSSGQILPASGLKMIDFKFSYITIRSYRGVWIWYTGSAQGGDDSATVLNIDELCDNLCGWLKSKSPEREIIFECVISLASRFPPAESKFIGFDKPFIRPSSEWKRTEDWELRVSFSLDSNNVPIVPNSKETAPSTLSEYLPVELAEIPTGPIYHGISHPEIHRIPRKYRQASHYRPRHFHSPPRKDVVARKSRTKK